MKKKFSFGCTDPWLLLSIIYAQEHGNSKLSSIIGYGDFINHAIFSLEELQGGMYRLTKSGYVIKKSDEFLPTDKILIVYHKVIKQKSFVNKDLEFIRKQLNAPEWTSDYDPSKANESGSYIEINKEVVEKAYKEYGNRTL